MITGAIFDVDGVLLDSMTIWKDLGSKYLRNKGIKPECELNTILFSMSMEQGAIYLKERYGLSESVEEVLEGIRKMIEDFYFYEVPAKEKAEKLLGFLKENKVIITAATSSPREHVERALKRNGLLSYIERIYTTSEVGSSKHEPEIYDLACVTMNTNRKETLVFEDSLYAIKTAAKAGYRVIGVYDANGETDHEGVRKTSEIYLNSFEDFFSKWEQLNR